MGRNGCVGTAWKKIDTKYTKTVEKRKNGKFKKNIVDNDVKNKYENNVIQYTIL